MSGLVEGPTGDLARVGSQVQVWGAQPPRVGASTDRRLTPEPSGGRPESVEVSVQHPHGERLNFSSYVEVRLAAISKREQTKRRRPPKKACARFDPIPGSLEPNAP